MDSSARIWNPLEWQFGESLVPSILATGRSLFFPLSVRRCSERFTTMFQYTPESEITNAPDPRTGPMVLDPLDAWECTLYTHSSSCVLCAFLSEKMPVQLMGSACL